MQSTVVDNRPRKEAAPRYLATARALQDAGVKTDSGSLSFDLKNSQREARPDPEGMRPKGFADLALRADEFAPGSAARARAVHHGLLDLSV